MKKCVNCWYLGSLVKYDQGKTPKTKERWLVMMCKFE
jgi:hypothetical protein